VLFLLLATAALKLFASVSPIAGAFLDGSDEVVWFVSKRQLMMLTGLIELGIVLLIVWGPQSKEGSVLVIAWLGLAFLAYRVAGRLLGATGSCGCLGAFAEPLAGVLSKIALAWMLGGSVILLSLHFPLRRQANGERNQRQGTEAHGGLCVDVRSPPT